MSSKSSDSTFNITLYALFSFAVIIILLVVSDRNDPLVAGTYISGNNCSILTCPAGERGLMGIGIVGPPGGTGPGGKDGKDGKDGINGIPGQDAMCIANPMCGVGPKGDKGDGGKDGLNGIGLPGADGKTGPKGDDGKDGTNGINGLNSTVPGPQGIPGVCDCFNISSISFEHLNITQSFALGGNFTCSAGSFIDPSCLVVGNCPDFQLCDSTFSSVFIKGGIIKPYYFQVGEPGTSGSPGTVLFGDRDTLSMLDYRLAKFAVYAERVHIAGRTSAKLSASSGKVIIDAGGSAGAEIIIGSGGRIVTTSLSDSLTNTGGSHQVFATGQIRLNTPVELVMSGSFVNITAPRINLGLIGTSVPWLSTDPIETFTLSPTLPLLSFPSPSIRIYYDVVFSEGANIISAATDGFQRIGPYLNIVGGRIRSTGTGAGNPISIENEITNSLPGEYVVFNDVEGIDLLSGTKITSTNGDVNIENSIGNKVNIGTNNIFDETAATVIGAAFSDGMSGSSGKFGTLKLNAIEVNTIYAQTINDGSGSCCVSDIRMKKNIKNVDRQQSMNKILALQPVEYDYIDNYLKVDHWVLNTTKVGFIAQDLEKEVPNAVKSMEKKINGVVIKDFRGIINSDFSIEMVGHMVNAMQFMHDKIESLENKLRQL